MHSERLNGGIFVISLNATNGEGGALLLLSRGIRLLESLTLFKVAILDPLLGLFTVSRLFKNRLWLLDILHQCRHRSWRDNVVCDQLFHDFWLDVY